MANLSDYYGNRVKFQRFTGPGTWTNPGAVDVIYVTAAAGGGGSGASATPFPGQLGTGGGGGAFCNRAALHVNGSPTPVVVGAGGGVAARGGQTRVGSGTSNRICLAGGGGGGPYQQQGSGHGGGSIDGVKRGLNGGDFAVGAHGHAGSTTAIKVNPYPQAYWTDGLTLGFPQANFSGGASLGGMYPGGNNTGAGAPGVVNTPGAAGRSGVVIIEWEE